MRALRRLTAHGLAACVVMALASEARAAGYGTREFSVTAMGQSYAGVSAQYDDPSYAAYTPAALAGVDNWDLAGGLITVWPDSDADYSIATGSLGQPTGGDAGPDGFVQAAYVPNLAARLRLSSEWSAGVSVSAPWGLSTIYDVDWAGRYYGHETTLMTVNVMPAVAYQPSAEFTFGAALQVLYAKGLLSNAIDVGTIGAILGIGGAQPTLEDGYGSFDAEDWGFGYMLGVQWAVTDRLRIGAVYRSEVALEMTGPVTFSAGPSATGAALAGLGLLQDTRGSTELTTPAVASLGASLAITPAWTISGEVAFTDWSVFEELRVEFANPAQPDEVTIFDWHDSWFAAVGATYEPNDDWALRAGVAYDQSPAAAARNVRIPDTDRVSLSLGADVRLTQRTRISLSVSHVFLDPAAVNQTTGTPSNALRGDLVGRTDAEATAIALGFTFR